MILGASGWIGSRLCQLNGLEIQAPLNSSASADEFKSWLSKQNAETYINCIGKVNGPDAKMHWANIGVLEELISHAHKTGARIVHLGSAAEYGNTTSAFVSENSETKPLSTYGKQKLQANLMLTEYVRKGGCAIGTRIFNVIGSNQPANTAIGQIIERVKSSSKDTSLTLDNYDVLRDYVPIDFVAKAILKLADLDFSGLVNIGSGRATRLLDLASEIGNEFNVKVVPGELYTNRVFSAVSDTALMDELGIKIPNLTAFELASLATGVN